MTDTIRRAIYSISIDGKSVTDNFEPLLISLRYTSADSGKSDNLEITLDDTGGQIALPREGADIEATIQWDDGDGGALRFTGKTDEPESILARGQGLILQITAHSADMKGKPKEKTEKHEDKGKFGDVAKKWGKAAGLEVKIDDQLASIERDYWWMGNESFLSWGLRMAGQLGATFKVAGKQAAFVPRNSNKSAGGTELARVSARYGENLITARLSPVFNRQRYKRARVRHYDQKEAKWKIEDVDIGDDGAEVDLTETQKAAGQSQAKDRAKSNSEESKRGKGGGSVTIDGDPRAISQAPMDVSGMRPGIDGEYRITTATHTVTRSGGWVSECQVEQPQGDAGKDSRKAAAK